MRYTRLDFPHSLSDPESRFAFRSCDGNVVVDFRDWHNTAVQVEFCDTWQFSCCLQNGDLRELPDGCMLELFDSREIARLRETRIAGSDDSIRHFVLSNNEDQWIEVIATSYAVRSGSAS